MVKNEREKAQCTVKRANEEKLLLGRDGRHCGAHGDGRVPILFCQPRYQVGTARRGRSRGRYDGDFLGKSGLPRGCLGAKGQLVGGGDWSFEREASWGRRSSHVNRERIE